MRSHVSRMVPLGLLCLTALCRLVPAPLSAQAPDTTRYLVRFPNPLHHEAEITVTFTGVASDPLELRMSRTSPGRYALHEFAKNVYSLRAVNGAGRSLSVSRPNPHQWDVRGHDGTVSVTYTLFADGADGTYSGIDATHAHLNMPATFMWARGLFDRPISITFEPPPVLGSGWRAATQLTPTSAPMTFTAPDFYYFMDSPTELSDHDVREWSIGPDSNAQSLRFALHHEGTGAQLDGYADLVERVVAEQIAVYGEPPRFDFGTYTFIADYLPWVYGDGMEHRNSTILTTTGSLDDPLDVLGTVSHEFFHAWNVERIRPKTLEPFDFEHANMSRELWLAEGFTSYYGPLTMRRAGITDDDDYASTIGSAINRVANSTGRRYHSAVEMSMQAPFVDAATSIDATNFPNTFLSYYTWGSVIGLGLDLTLRTRLDLTLDDFMRAMWRAYGLTEVPYTVEDAQTTLAQVTNDAAFAREFFDRYVRGGDILDYEALLAPAGFLLRRAEPGRSTIGDASFREDDGAVYVDDQTLVGSPLYEAGIDYGDRIAAIDGSPVTSAQQIADAVSARDPGSIVTLTVEGRGTRREVELTLAQDPTLEVVTYEAAGLAVSAEIRAFREAWLGSKVER